MQKTMHHKAMHKVRSTISLLLVFSLFSVVVPYESESDQFLEKNRKSVLFTPFSMECVLAPTLLNPEANSDSSEVFPKHALLFEKTSDDLDKASGYLLIGFSSFFAQRKEKAPIATRAPPRFKA